MMNSFQQAYDGQKPQQRATTDGLSATESTPTATSNSVHPTTNNTVHDSNTTSDTWNQTSYMMPPEPFAFNAAQQTIGPTGNNSLPFASNTNTIPLNSTFLSTVTQPTYVQPPITQISTQVSSHFIPITTPAITSTKWAQTCQGWPTFALPMHTQPLMHNCRCIHNRQRIHNRRCTHNRQCMRNRRRTLSRPRTLTHRSIHSSRCSLSCKCQFYRIGQLRTCRSTKISIQCQQQQQISN